MPDFAPVLQNFGTCPQRILVTNLYFFLITVALFTFQFIFAIILSSLFSSFLLRDAMRKRGLCCRPVSVCQVGYCIHS